MTYHIKFFVVNCINIKYSLHLIKHFYLIQFSVIVTIYVLF